MSQGRQEEQRDEPPGRPRECSDAQKRGGVGPAQRPAAGAERQRRHRPDSPRVQRLGGQRQDRHGRADQRRQQVFVDRIYHGV
jgi:hypothetical protein